MVTPEQQRWLTLAGVVLGPEQGVVLLVWLFWNISVARMGGPPLDYLSANGYVGLLALVSGAVYLFMEENK